MENLKVRTRGNTNPKGKPRVYFTCHPADFEKFFDTVSNEIISKQNCAIWYADGVIERNEEFLAVLKQMQLFVMPVTTNLLCTDNVALESEFKFAIENHIPVLPLMQESGLEELFNKKCGDLQFLDKRNTDVTAISYNDKLEKFLSSVLIGDELAEKIRAAFDAYIFLSYRKKDRKYAQELMHLIHKNEFCRDIAIWYDEFLTPGENFNDSIKSAIKKSDLFVLTVTPNLINEENYVIMEEYPIAQRESKIILPAEIVETDKNELTRHFENIPKCINAKDESQLSKALLDAIQKIAIKRNDGSSKHNFFIGLAYLNGIDVEVDFSKALELIDSSANAGLLDACEQLVKMYRMGQGVPIDYYKAIDYQNKKICNLKENYIINNSEENNDIIFWELLTLCDYYREINNIKSAKEAIFDAKNYIDKNKSLINTKRKEAAFYERVGDLYKTDGNLTQAKKCFEIYFNKLVEVCDFDPTDDKTNDVLIAFCRLGDIMIEEGNFEKALENYNKLLFAEEQLKFLTQADNYRKTIYSSVLSNISYIILNKTGKTKQARCFAEKALNMSAIIAEEEKTLEAQRDLSIKNMRMGEICIAERKSEEALKWYNNACYIMEILIQKTQNQLFINDIVLIYIKIVDVYKNMEKYFEALEKAKKALDLIKNAYKTDRSLQLKRSFAYSLNKLGDIMLLLAVEHNKAMGNNEEVYFEKNINDGSIRTDLVFNINNINLTTFLERKRCIESAISYYDEALVHFKEIIDKAENIKSKRDLKCCYNNISMLFDFIGASETAEKYSLKALNLASEIAEETTSNVDIDALAEAFYNYAKISNDIQCYKSAFEIWNFLCEDCQNIKKFKESRDMVKKALNIYDDSYIIPLK